MIAPSPDWFVGVSALSLMENGQWVDTKTVTLFAYDAGTESGEIYTSADEDTEPQEPISKLTTPPFLVGGDIVPMGTFAFERQ
jgi:hypothetical protein